MRQYNELVERVLKEGKLTEDRTGVGTLSVFGDTRTYCCRDNRLPMITTKKVNFDAILKELLWFIRGETNTNTLGCKIWDAWADSDGECGKIYGYQWRKGFKVDQLKDVIENIKKNPYSRRHVVTAWNPWDLDEMALPPCHMFFQFNVDSDGFLDLQMYQRSADIAIGVPFNITSYCILLKMVAQECSLKPGNFVHTIGNAHIYTNHVSTLEMQMELGIFGNPSLTIANKPFFDLTFDDFTLYFYVAHPSIKYEVAV